MLCAAFIMAGAVGVRVFGFKSVSMHGGVGLRAGLMSVHERGSSRACVLWGGLEGGSGPVPACP